MRSSPACLRRLRETLTPKSPYARHVLTRSSLPISHKYALRDLVQYGPYFIIFTWDFLLLLPVDSS